MEITLQELAELIGNSNGGAKSEPNTAPSESIFAHLIGERVLVRTRISGVSIGIAESIETNAGGIAITLNEGIRIWQWSRSFTCSEIAISGATVRYDDHPDGITITDSGCELLPVTVKAWDTIIDSGTKGKK